MTHVRDFADVIAAKIIQFNDYCRWRNTNILLLCFSFSFDFLLTVFQFFTIKKKDVVVPLSIYNKTKITFFIVSFVFLPPPLLSVPWRSDLTDDENWNQWISSILFDRFKKKIVVTMKSHQNKLSCSFSLIHLNIL